MIVARLKRTRLSVLKKNAYGAKQTDVAKNVLQENRRKQTQKQNQSQSQM
jgi:hypothetical protein